MGSGSRGSGAETGHHEKAVPVETASIGGGGGPSTMSRAAHEQQSHFPSAPAPLPSNVDVSSTSWAAAAAAGGHPGGSGGGINPAFAYQPQTVTVVIAHRPAEKSLFEAYLLCFPLGILGLHNFYLRRYGFGVLYLLTGGVLGIGWLIDLVRMPWLVKEANKKIRNPEEDVATVSICDAYITWFPLGILGLHQYYLRRYNWGAAYTFSLGLFGIGWIVDLFLIPCYVRSTNKRLEEERSYAIQKKVSLCDAYALGATPAGIFGGHHFYMGRYFFGVMYLFTGGVCGIGWIVDWFRMKWLVHRTNHPEEHLLGTRHKYVDDAYVAGFPLGILGLHHFYLKRPAWGVLYLFTAGLFGIGWLVDMCRMPCLVGETNRRLEEEMRVMTEIQQQFGVQPTGVVHRQVQYQQGPQPYNNNNINNVVVNETPVLQPPSYEIAIGGSSYQQPSSRCYSGQAMPPTYQYGPSMTSISSNEACNNPPQLINNAFEKD